jgi:hypothetical protein
MAQYPQGVSTFIPDYQPYEPDLNFTANVLQLKQTQYDQNWNRLNSMYGQLLNAPLTHDDSVKKRDNTLKRIDFDLQRITGMDLSLEQNVQQATQLFRPFYEDQNLMKDMVFTKNAAFEKALGEGKRISTDEKVNAEYWDEGLRAIDYRIQEFKETPYDQLTSFGDVKYTPFVNVEKAAMELATKMKYKIKRTTPQGDWMITEQNGDPLIPQLQSVFYSALGNDPKVRDFYATRAYLERKNYIASKKDTPEFGGSAELAEKTYLNNALQMLQKQTELTRTNLVNEQQTNQKMIDKLEKSIADGTDVASTKENLTKYQEANAQIEEMLKQNDSDRNLITDNLNKTMTSTGGSKLSLDDTNQLRSRVDAVMASTFLQGDLDKAARDFSKLDYELKYDANPFAVQKQKYLYDSSLISQRAAAQKDVAYYKYLLDAQKMDTKEKLASGLYQKNPETGKVEIKPELAEVQAAIDLMAKTGQTDPKKLQATINDIYKNDAKGAKKKILSVLDALNREGIISNSELLGVLSDKEYSGFNMTPLINWLQKDGKKANGKPIDKKIRNMLVEEGVYTTDLEKEEMLPGTAGGDEAQAKLSSAARGSLDDLSPEAITRMTKRLMEVIQKKNNIPSVRDNSDVADLIDLSRTLDDYAAFRKTYLESKKKLATEVRDKLKADGFQYADFLFKEGYDMVATPEEFMANVRSARPDDIINDNGMSWAGFLNTTMAGSTAGAVVGAVPGAIGGALAGAVGYLGSGIIDGAWTAFKGKTGKDYVRLVNANTSFFGNPYSVGEEFESMIETYDDYVQNSLLTSPVPGLHHKISNEDLSGWGWFKNSQLGQWLGFQEQGTGLYSSHGAGITIEPGLISPTWNHFLEIKKALKDLNLDDTSANNGYIAFTGVNTRPDQAGDIAVNKEIFNAIYNDFIPRTNKKGSGLGRFQVQMAPLGGEDVGNGAIVFRLPEEYLKKWKPDSNGEKVKGLTEDVYKNILANGITVITDASKLQNIALYRNSYRTAEQIRIEAAGGEGVTYDDPRYPGFSLNFRTDPLEPGTMSVTQRFMMYDPNTGKMVQDQNVENLSNMGTNIKEFRNNYFTTFVRQHLASQNDLRRQYEQQ